MAMSLFLPDIEAVLARKVCLRFELSSLFFILVLRLLYELYVTKLLVVGIVVPERVALGITLVASDFI